jgi:hypothetical protein
LRNFRFSLAAKSDQSLGDFFGRHDSFRSVPGPRERVADAGRADAT